MQNNISDPTMEEQLNSGNKQRVDHVKNKRENVSVLGANSMDKGRQVRVAIQ